MTNPFPVKFTKAERDLIQRVADQRGLTFDEAASLLGNGGIEDRFKKRTGKKRAKVYSIPKKNKDDEK